MTITIKSNKEEVKDYIRTNGLNKGPNKILLGLGLKEQRKMLIAQGHIVVSTDEGHKKAKPKPKPKQTFNVKNEKVIPVIRENVPALKFGGRPAGRIETSGMTTKDMTNTKKPPRYTFAEKKAHQKKQNKINKNKYTDEEKKAFQAKMKGKPKKGKPKYTDEEKQAHQAKLKAKFGAAYVDPFATIKETISMEQHVVVKEKKPKKVKLVEPAWDAPLTEKELTTMSNSPAWDAPLTEKELTKLKKHDDKIKIAQMKKDSLKIEKAKAKAKKIEQKNIDSAAAFAAFEKEKLEGKHKSYPQQIPQWMFSKPGQTGSGLQQKW
mgnify:CR=1 FL=1